MPDQILILGGVAAGMSAASRARRIAPGARITVLEAGPAVAYGACGLPLFIAGQVASLEALRARSEEDFAGRRIEVLTGHAATAIEPSRRRVLATDAAGRERGFAYDRLVIATGAVSRGFAGDECPLLFRANTWAQTARLEAFLHGLAPGHRARAAVIGGGYIGLEVAEALAARGCQVRIIQAGATVLPSFDADMAELVAARVQQAAGVELQRGVRVTNIISAASGIGLDTSAGRLAADFAVEAGGLAPNTALAAAAGIALGPTAAIAVDDRQQTNMAGILAAGDCAESRLRITGAPVWIPLGAVANQQGRIAGQNAAGGPVARYPGVLGSLVLRVFGIEAGRTGLGLAAARRAGFDAAAERIEAAVAAAYMSRERITLKWIYDRASGRGLGAQLAGPPGTVLPRLHAAAAALAARMTLDQIETLDLAYAPAVAPLYDPLAIAAHRARR